jgi:hypothetical protein
MCRTCVERVFTVTATYWIQRSALNWKIMKFRKRELIWNEESVHAKRQKVENFVSANLLESDVKLGM